MLRTLPSGKQAAGAVPGPAPGDRAGAARCSSSRRWRESWCGWPRGPTTGARPSLSRLRRPSWSRPSSARPAHTITTPTRSTGTRPRTPTRRAGHRRRRQHRLADPAVLRQRPRQGRRRACTSTPAPGVAARELVDLHRDAGLARADLGAHQSTQPQQLRHRPGLAGPSWPRCRTSAPEQNIPLRDRPERAIATTWCGSPGSDGEAERLRSTRSRSTPVAVAGQPTRTNRTRGRTSVPAGRWPPSA